MDKLSRTNECVTIGRCKISWLLFKDDLVLMASFKSGFQHTLNGFEAACDITGMKVSTSKTEVLHLSLHIKGVSLKHMEKFKYVGVAFTSDGRRDEELDVWSSKAMAVMRALHHSVILKWKLLRKAKLLVFKSIFIVILIYGHKS